MVFFGQPGNLTWHTSEFGGSNHEKGFAAVVLCWSILGTLSGILFVVTLFSRDWIENIFHVDPDQGQGWVEWLIVVALALVAVGLGALARSEWRRAAAKA